jgi:phosphoglycolate phosphatase
VANAKVPILIFDLDGTLVDSVQDLRAALNRLLASKGLAPFTEPEVKLMVGDGAGVLVTRALAARGQKPGPDDLASFVADYSANAAVETRLFPGAADAIDSLLAAGWRLAVCTNKPVAPARSLLADLGVADKFAAIGGGDSFPVRKPDPAHLRATIEQAGGDPAAAIMLGDHANDVLAATGAGIPCIWAGWGYGKPGSEAGAAGTAPDFAAVKPLAETLLARAGRRK